MNITRVANQYFICPIDAPLEPIAWSIPNPQHDVTTVYFGKVLEAMERKLAVSGLTFYLTWDTKQLPSYGDDVVVIVLGDEYSRVPAYIHKVRAVFKTLSMSSMLGDNLLQKPSYASLMQWLQFAKVLLVRTPGLVSSLIRRWRGDRIAPIYDVPLGYYKQQELPIAAIANRHYDLFFAGSIILNYPRWDRRWLVRNPKDISRKAMLDAIERIRSKYPELQIGMEITGDFGQDAQSTLDNRSYSEKLMDAKLCLAPRGSLNETFRFFEGLRYGCIIITDPLPDRWFYDRTPAIQLKDWHELERIVEELLIENRQFLKQKHEESLRSWQEQCSETAVGNYMAEKLNLIFSQHAHFNCCATST
jgi:hypothetical protein